MSNTPLEIKGPGQKRIKALIAPPDEDMAKKRRSTTGFGRAGEDKILVFPKDLSTHYMALQFHRY